MTKILAVCSSFNKTIYTHTEVTRITEDVVAGIVKRFPPLRGCAFSLLSQMPLSERIMPYVQGLALLNVTVGCGVFLYKAGKAVSQRKFGEANKYGVISLVGLTAILYNLY